MDLSALRTLESAKYGGGTWMESPAVNGHNAGAGTPVPAAESSR